MTDSSFSRRELLTAGSTLAVLGTTAAGAAIGTSRGGAPQPPFDSLRDYVAALEAHGLLLRIPEVDQDAWEATGLVCRAADLYGFEGVPALWFDRVKIGGRWFQGPLLSLLQANLDTDAVTLGVPLVPGDGRANYRRAKAKCAQMLQQGHGSYPAIPPVTVAREAAPCKQVVLEGADIDLTKFAFIQTIPGDAGRYVNATSVFTHDPVLGSNFGTYRCQLKGPRLLGLNPEEGQAGWKALMAAKARGEERMPVSIALGQDPVTWFISCSRVVPRFGDKPIDEMAVAGGLRGKPVELVKSETNDLLVPAHAEMIIEGEVPLQVPGQPEGPFGEMFGYLGARKSENFFLDVTCVTHRGDPWVVNMYTGFQRGMATAPADALSEHLLRRSVPAVVETWLAQDAMGIYVVSVDKTGPGQGMKAGMEIAKFVPVAKVVIVVDKDIDVMDKRAVMFALGSRWSSLGAVRTLEGQRALITDPTARDTLKTDKIVIDATRQLPEEGGVSEFAPGNRALLEAAAPDLLAAVDRRFGTVLRKWRS